jgi:haloacetate dehalogenase
MAAYPGAINDQTFAEYLRCFRDPATIHGSCEDYRAAATVDLDHDTVDLDHKISSVRPAITSATRRSASLREMLQTVRKAPKEYSKSCLEMQSAGHQVLPT